MCPFSEFFCYCAGTAVYFVGKDLYGKPGIVATVRGDARRWYASRKMGRGRSRTLSDVKAGKHEQQMDEMEDRRREGIQSLLYKPLTLWEFLSSAEETRTHKGSANNTAGISRKFNNRRHNNRLFSTAARSLRFSYLPGHGLRTTREILFIFPPSLTHW